MINKVILVGNLGQDPEMRYSQSGLAIANFSIATTERFKGQDGEFQERTEWHRVVAFGRLAEIIGEYLTKGRQVYIEGRLQTRKWQDRDGNDRYTTEVVANEMKMLGQKGDGGGRSQGRRDYNDNRGGQGKRQDNRGGARGGANRGGGRQNPAPPPDDDFEDDIPF